MRLRERPMHLHRKVWEYCYITQALHERDLLRPGMRGLGFAVGREPLTALFASLGCEIVATDLAVEEAAKGGWVETSQHAESLEALNGRGICPSDLFRQRVSFRVVDMRHIPDDLGIFDFTWSACSLEHLGSGARGEQFIFDSLSVVKPGGFAVHTTEYNVSSNRKTITDGGTVLYRRRDLEQIAMRLHAAGHLIEVDFALGHMPADSIIDRVPYRHENHLKLELGGYIVTSFGLIIQRAL